MFHTFVSPLSVYNVPVAIIQNSWKSLTDKSRLNDAIIDYEQQEEEDDNKLEELLKELTSKTETEIESEEEDQDLIPEFQQEMLNYKIKLENDDPIIKIEPISIKNE